MFIIQILIAILIGYAVGIWHMYPKLKRKERECSNKRRMIEERDRLIQKQKDDLKIYKQIKQIYRTEPKLINRHDKVKELIEKDND